MPVKKTVKKSKKKVSPKKKTASKKAQVKKAAPKKVAPKKKAPAKKTSAVKKGTTYECRVCGYRIIVDQVCGCVEEHVQICCGKPMKKKAPKRK